MKDNCFSHTYNKNAFSVYILTTSVRKHRTYQPKYEFEVNRYTCISLGQKRRLYELSLIIHLFHIFQYYLFFI